VGEYRVKVHQYVVDDGAVAHFYRQGDLMPVPDAVVEQLIAEGSIERPESKKTKARAQETW
jgi:hypothetical protein